MSARKNTKRAVAGLVGAGLILGAGAPAFADATITPVPPAASEQGVLQVALDKAQQSVFEAQENLDAAKQAEERAYADFEAQWQGATQDVTAQITTIAAAYAALQAAQAALDAAEQAHEEGVANLEQLKADVAAAREEVERTAVDGKDALDIVAADYLKRVAPKEADKLLRCAINSNSTACKNATIAYEKALAEHKEFAAAHEEAAAAYAAALQELATASARLELAQGNLGEIAIDALRWARDEAQKAFDSSVDDMVSLVKQRAEDLAGSAAAIARAEAVTELRRGALRTAKAVLEDLLAHVTPPEDGTADDNIAVVPEDVTAGDGTGEDDMGLEGGVEDVTAGDGTSGDNMGIHTQPAEPPAPPQPGPDTGTSATAVSHKVVYTWNTSVKKWRATSGRPATITRAASIVVHTPQKAKNLRSAKAKAKRVAAGHKASFTGITYRNDLRKARVVVTWTTAN